VTTPLEPAAPTLTHRRDVWLKREDVHELGAFKWRAALPVARHYQEQGATGLVTASTGNHGAATAWAARHLGMRAIVFAPTGSSNAKLAHLERLGADVRLGSADVDEAKDAARAYARGRELPFFEDGAEPIQYEAYGAVADEVVEQLERPLGAVVVPIGNGALAGGIGRALGTRSPATLRVGVVSKEAPVMALSWEARRPVTSDRCATIADGLAVRVAIPYAVEALNKTADRVLQVSERAIARAVATFDAAGIRAEPAAGAALAAIEQLDNVAAPIVLIVTGGNIDEELLARCRDAPESFPA
jgi:threonine dehydratase